MKYATGGNVPGPEGQWVWVPAGCCIVPLTHLKRSATEMHIEIRNVDPAAIVDALKAHARKNGPLGLT